MKEMKKLYLFYPKLGISNKDAADYILDLNAGKELQFYGCSDGQPFTVYTDEWLELGEYKEKFGFAYMHYTDIDYENETSVDIMKESYERLKEARGLTMTEDMVQSRILHKALKKYGDGVPFRERYSFYIRMIEEDLPYMLCIGPIVLLAIAGTILAVLEIMRISSLL